MYCKKCGSKLDDVTGLCPNCTQSEVKKHKRLEKIDKSLKKKERYSEYKVNAFIHVLLIIITILLVGFLGISTLTYFEIVKTPALENLLEQYGIKQIKNNITVEDEDLNIDDFLNEMPDAEEYYNASSIVESVIDVDKADGLLTETEVIHNLNNRGFEDFPITTNYSIEGEYYKEKVISDTSSEKHPIYQTFYLSSTEQLWTIYIINDSIFAYPVSFNMDHSTEIQSMVSESETIISYVNTKNQFYETKPHDSVLNVKLVDNINSEVLDNIILE